MSDDETTPLALPLNILRYSLTQTVIFLKFIKVCEQKLHTRYWKFIPNIPNALFINPLTLEF